jgi:hypothetical protein
MATAGKTGGEVDAYCNKCKLTLGHTVLATVGEKIARVQCNTCRTQHAYRGKSAPAPRSRSSGASRTGAGAAVTQSRQTINFDQLVAGRDLSSAHRYSPKDTYAKDEIVEHPSFGYGIVTQVRTDKVEVLFKTFEKTLVQGRAGAPGEKPHFDHPRPHAMLATDKPLAAQEPAPLVVEEEEEEEEDEDGKPRPHHPPVRPV